MSRSEDAAGQSREALRDAIEWADDLDARLTREDVTLAEVEAHAVQIKGASVGIPAAADGPA